MGEQNELHELRSEPREVCSNIERKERGREKGKPPDMRSWERLNMEGDVSGRKMKSSTKRENRE